METATALTTFNEDDRMIRMIGKLYDTSMRVKEDDLLGVSFCLPPPRASHLSIDEKHSDRSTDRERNKQEASKMHARS